MTGVEKQPDGEWDTDMPDWILIPFGIAAFGFVAAGLLAFTAYHSLKDRFTGRDVD